MHKGRRQTDKIDIPMRHHLKAPLADSIHDSAALLSVGNFELLLEKDRSLLVGRLDDSSDKRGIGRRRRRVQEGKEVDRLPKQEEKVSNET